MKKIMLICAVLLLSVTAMTAATEQNQGPAETKNAALRYWMAFAEMQDPPSGKATSDLLERTAAGGAPWDETTLGPILDKNEMAIGIMQRATRLPDCDWGLEYDLGSRASIAYVPRARALARLNTLQGMRLAGKGETQKAIDAWLAGIGFSQHLARGGSLIFSLIAKMDLVSTFQALTQEAQRGTLSSEQEKQIAAAVRALPETGFDWGQAMWYEEASAPATIDEMRRAASPAAYYQAMMGKPAPERFALPTAADVAAFHKLMASTESALRLPPEKAQNKLQTLQDAARTLHPFFQETTPSFLKVNEARMEVQKARQKLLQALATK